jgi:hypothetical protein
MPPTDLLEFEEPIGVLLKEIEALSMLPRTPERERSIESLRRRADEIRTEIYANLTPWQRVLVARHPNRPNTLDYVERLFTGWEELHGDRRFADDHAIITGLADYRGEPVVIVGPPEGARHEAEDLPQLRLRAPRRIPEGAAGHAARRQVQPADHRVHRHAGRLSGRGVRRTGGRRGHRAEPPRDDDARGPDHRDRLREGGSGARSASRSATAC